LHSILAIKVAVTINLVQPVAIIIAIIIISPFILLAQEVVVRLATKSKVIQFEKVTLL